MNERERVENSKKKTWCLGTLLSGKSFFFPFLFSKPLPRSCQQKWLFPYNKLLSEHALRQAYNEHK